MPIIPYTGYKQTHCPECEDIARIRATRSIGLYTVRYCECKNCGYKFKDVQYKDKIDNAEDSLANANQSTLSRDTEITRK